MAPLQICLLGASGRSGVEVLRQALEKGHKVKAVVRKPEKIEKYKHENLEIASANIFDAESLAQVFQGVDVVISTLGFWYPPIPENRYSNSCKAIVEAMNAVGVKRLIMMLSWFTDKESRKSAKLFGFRFRYLELPTIVIGLKDMDRAEQFLKTSEEAKNVEYTLISPPYLTEGPKTDQEIIVETEQNFIENVSRKISRSDVAAFIIKSIEEKSYIRSNGVAIPWKLS